ncbi:MULTISPECIES: plasmid SOS inhibition protein A [Citrobacter freundii complex]|uniref:plasmid SOS inhibition protein A n=1 Tax=Citrobacter freundii complex TaxID=1344959 RepID=UPI0018FFFD04|nr:MULTISPECIES: plasmid SOS inhibition protein A [Citrobacter freundii complex]MBJ8983598.1 plasmid SOS inhibition protein A [Citrobacter freundii]MBK6263163.1 plasmid SOS inhibition protein A [Citrobacter youngae]MCR3712211.1 plasmid SOS inhibition protein A [Citrobacter freundii]
MIPRHLSLVTQLPEREAALRAIIAVEEGSEQNGSRHPKPYPYARAFFRILTGSSKISGKAINQVRGAYWLKFDKISLARYEEAFDILISSRGRLCYPPLGTDMVQNLFPEQAFSISERHTQREVREENLYSRQESRRYREKEEKYQNRAGQAEIDLAFQTPETLRAWYESWSQQDIRDYDIQRMLWAWTERSPSLSHLVKAYYDRAHEIVLDVHDVAESSTPAEKELERWMVPNKITLRSVWP